MCIYCGTAKYRKIYEHHYGPIPTDELGRSYHIHHKDGNKKNNHPANLEALSIVEHYNIHVKQEDWGACLRLAPLINISADTISKLASKANNSRLDTGTHIFQDDLFKSKLPDWSRDSALRRVANGTNPFLNKERAKEWAAQRVASGVYSSQEFKSKCSNNNLRRIAEGTNPFAPGKNPSQQITQCPHCLVEGRNMMRWHFDNCKRSPAYKERKNRFGPKECPHCQHMCLTYQAAAYHFDKCCKSPGFAKRTRSPSKQLTCPHCMISGSSAGMKRWHFDKCQSLKGKGSTPQTDG